MYAGLDTSGTAVAGGYGAALLETVLALLLVSALAWVVLRFVARRRSTGWTGPNPAITVEARAALDVKNALVVVAVEGKRLLIATSPDGPARLLAELGPRPRQEERQ